MEKTKRVTFTIPEDLLSNLDAAAEAMNLSRSSYIAVAVTFKMQQDEMMRQLPYLVHKLKMEEAEAKQG